MVLGVRNTWSCEVSPPTKYGRKEKRHRKEFLRPEKVLFLLCLSNITEELLHQLT